MKNNKIFLRQQKRTNKFLNNIWIRLTIIFLVSILILVIVYNISKK